MSPQCEFTGKYILPIFRSMIAKELVQKYRLSQTDAAKKLGTTQAAVSQYLSSKRAYKGMDMTQVEVFLPKIKLVAEATAQKLVSGDVLAGDVAVDFCCLCSSFCRSSADICGPVPDYCI